MPHLAAIVGAGVIVAGVCIAVNHALDERRRQREEDREFEAAIAASLYEFEQDSQRRQRQRQRQAQVEWEQQEAIIASAVAHSDAERQRNDGTLRQRRRRTSGLISTSMAPNDEPVGSADSNLFEMTERMHVDHLHANAPPPLVELFDAGPSSRASDPACFAPPPRALHSPWDADFVSVASPSHDGTSIHETVSMRAGPRCSRVSSPMPDSPRGGDAFQHVVAQTTGKAASDAGTDTTGVLISRPSTPIETREGFSLPTSATQRIISLPVSPSFSAVSFIDAREVHPSSDRTADREIDSAWSDLGEDSSEDEAGSVAERTAQEEEIARREETRQQRMRYLGRLHRGEATYAPLG